MLEEQLFISPIVHNKGDVVLNAPTLTIIYLSKQGHGFIGEELKVYGHTKKKKKF